MGRHRIPIKTDSYDGRKYTTIPVTKNGRTSYPKIHLRTKNDEVAQRRLIALEGLDDPKEARRRIGHLASAVSEEQERARLADFIHPPMFRQRVSIDDAREELSGILDGFVDIDDVPEEVLERWRHASSALDWQPILRELGLDSYYFLENPDIYETLKVRGREADPEWWRKNPDKHHEVLAAEWGDSPEEWLDHGASSEKLLDCISHFETVKRNERKGESHIRSYRRTFERFVEFVTNKPLNRLTKQDFIGWQDHVYETRGERGSKWVNDQLTPIAAILKIANRRMQDDILPAAWRTWIEFDKATYKPGLHNREPMPLAVFEACLKQAEDWASIDIKAAAETMPVRGANARAARANNFRQATRIKRAGYMMRVVLRLCCNAGCDPIDLERLKWKDIRLTKSLPLFMLPRVKAEGQIGTSMPRKTPMLPSTVEALRQWRTWRNREIAEAKGSAQERAGRTRDCVFVNDRRRPFSSDKISHAFARLAKAVGKKTDDWRLKHLRNVGATLGRRHKRHPDKRTTFLAHSEDGTNHFYEGDVGEDYLVTLINLIGDEYFDGEQVYLPKECAVAK